MPVYPESTRHKMAELAPLASMLANRYIASAEGYARNDAHLDAAVTEFNAAMSLAHAARLLIIEGGDTIARDEAREEREAAERIETRAWQGLRAVERQQTEMSA